MGNDFSSEAIYGKADARTGQLLIGNHGFFEPIASRGSGFYVSGQSNHISKIVDNRGNDFILATQNNDSLQIFSMAKTLD